MGKIICKIYTSKNSNHQVSIEANTETIFLWTRTQEFEVWLKATKNKDNELQDRASFSYKSLLFNFIPV